MHLAVILKLILFFVSSLGTWEFIRRRARCDINFLPALTVGVQVTILFVAGILNVLKIAAYGMYAFGFLCAGYYLLKDRKEFLFRYFAEVGIQYLIVASVLICFAVWNEVFNVYGNFAHWALVVQQMLQTNRFPNFSDSLIMFKFYPLGSGMYIYYFARLIGKPEFIQMLAQAYMMIVCIVPLLKFKLNRYIAIVLGLLYSNFIFCYSLQISAYRISDLIVDTLLPLFGMVTVYLFYSECIKEDCGTRMPLLWLAPMFIAEVQIKNSGLFFVAMVLVMMVLCAKRYSLPSKQLLLAGIAPLVSIFLWQRHCLMVFINANGSKHAMSWLNYKNTFLSKTNDEIILIVKKFCAFTFSGSELYFCLLFILVAILIAWFSHSKTRHLIGKFVLFIVVSYATYMFGMLVMYLVSMPGSEATRLASSWRYRGTVLIAFYFASFGFMLYSASLLKNSRKRIAWCIAVLFAVVCSWTNGTFTKYETVFKTSVSPINLWMRSLVNDGLVEKNASYFVCISHDDFGYVHFLGRYLFGNQRTTSRVVRSVEDINEAEKFRYLLIWDRNNRIVKDWVVQNYPNQEGKDIIDLMAK